MNNPWDDISTPSREFNVRLVSEKHPLKLFWGKDIKGGYLFVVQLTRNTEIDKKVLPELNGIRIAISQDQTEKYLILLLNDKANWEIFKSLCVDLIYACKDVTKQADAVNIVIARLLKWHDFLKREKLHVLSTEAIKGLIGELLFLRDTLVPDFGWDESISFWKGPLGTPQDFAVYDTAVEVKAQSGISKPYVQISSLEQMEAQLPHFYLVVNTLAAIKADEENAFTLNSLIADIKASLGSAEIITRDLFESLLFQIGYIPLNAYDEPYFKCVSTKTFYVDEKFPRLTVGSVPSGITKATYQISIDSCLPFEKKLSFTK